MLFRKSVKGRETGAAGSNAKIYTVEVGCQGFIATSTVKLMRDLGITGKALHPAVKELSRVEQPVAMTEKKRPYLISQIRRRRLGKRRGV